MIERYIDMLGIDQTIELLNANEKPLIPSIRVNTLKKSPNELKNRLEKRGFILEPVRFLNNGFRVLKAPYNLGSTHEYLQGYYYLQNVASMWASIILAPKKGDIVIDMCAAPGGKATHLAELMENKGKLILIDRSIKRIRALEFNIRRLGILNSIILNFDSTKLGKLNIKADKILLDAPCTGEGLIREDPKRKTSRTISDIEKLSKIQKKLLTAGLESLKHGGRLLYTTCSIAPEENELVINDIINSMNNIKIIKLTQELGKPGLIRFKTFKLNREIIKSRRLYPHMYDSIGFFYCLIEKNS
ncbi:MAG: RsmB/NOP family class I SAM-dependent RNA methyltransferase [Promethearchaeia archaeon]